LPPSFDMVSSSGWQKSMVVEVLVWHNVIDVDRYNDNGRWWRWSVLVGSVGLNLTGAGW
jgi:hypothetical protein